MWCSISCILPIYYNLRIDFKFTLISKERGYSFFNIERNALIK